MTIAGERASLALVVGLCVAACSDDPSGLGDAASDGGVTADATPGDAIVHPDAREPQDADAIDADATTRDLGPGDAGAADADPPGDGGAPEDAGSNEDAMVPDLGPRARVAFSRGGGLQTDLFLAELDGTNLEPLVTVMGADVSPTWSPDGTTIAFASSRAGRYGIYAIDLATRTTSTVSLELLVALGPSYSPDGTQIAFQGRASAQTGFDVYVMSSSGGPATQLTTHTGNDSGPAWSPDGQTIYFVSNRTGVFEVYAMNADGTNQRALTTASQVIGRPTASPDGTALYYAAGDENQTVVLRHELPGGTTTPLTNNLDAEPSPSPDGRYLVFSTLRFGDPELMILDLVAGTQPTRITTDPAVDGTPIIGPVVP